MKAFYSVLFIFFLDGLFNNNAYSQTIYHNDTYHISLLLPENWYEISKNNIDDNIRKVSEANGTKFINYIFGFQSSKSNNFQYPYILVQHNGTELSWDEFLQVLIMITYELDKIDNRSYSERLSELNENRVTMNKEKRTYMTYYDRYVDGFGEIRSIIFIILGKYGFLQFNIYIKKTEYEKYLPQINQIIESIKYDDGYEYIMQNTSAEQLPLINNDEIIKQAKEKSLSGSATAIVIMVIVGLIGLIAKFGKDTEKKNLIKTLKK